MRRVKLTVTVTLAVLASGLLAAAQPKLTPKEASKIRSDFEKLLKDEKKPEVRRAASERILATDGFWIGVYQRAADELAAGELAAERWDAAEKLYASVFARADKPVWKEGARDWYERNLVSLKTRQGDYDGALKLMEKRGDKAGIANLYKNTLGDFAKAEAIYREILDDPKSGDQAFGSAYIAVAEHDLAVRERCFDRFCGKTANSTNAALNRIAKEWISMRQNDTHFGRWEAVLLNWRLARRIYDTQKTPVAFKIAQYAAYAACGARDFAQAVEICDFALASSTNFAPVEAYQLRMMSALLPKPADAKAVAAADAKFGAGIPPKDRLGALQRTGSAAMLGNREDLVRVLDAYAKGLFKEGERLVYTVRYSADPIFEAADFDKLDIEKSPMASKFGGDLKSLVTDVATGRGAVSDGASSSKAPPTIRIAADDWGLHFRYDVPCTNAAAMRTGDLASGSFEGYLSTGLGKPYASLIYDIAKADLWYWTTTYETMNRRNAKRHDTDNTRAATAYRTDGVTVYYALSWDIFAAELPDDGTEWEYENIYWGPKSSSAWNGLKGVHHRSSWGRLRFVFSAAELAAIRRRQLVKGMRVYWSEKYPSNDGPKVFDNFKDKVFGDPAFFERELLPLCERIEAYGKRIAPTMSDEEAMTLSREILPTLVNLKYVVARKRANYLAEKFTK